jgi:hypothetical protein
MALVTNWYFIVIQSLHQTHDTHYYENLKNINQTPKNYMGVNIYSLLDFFTKEKLEKKLKIKNKGNRKSNFIFWNFEDQIEWKTREGKKWKNIIKGKF